MLIERDVLAVALTDERLLQQQFDAETVEHARLRVNVQMKPTYIVRLNAHVVTLLRRTHRRIALRCGWSWFAGVCVWNAGAGVESLCHFPEQRCEPIRVLAAAFGSTCLGHSADHFRNLFGLVHGDEPVGHCLYNGFNLARCGKRGVQFKQYVSTFRAQYGHDPRQEETHRSHASAHRGSFRR
jgi:hypothetical protein